MHVLEGEAPIRGGFRTPGFESRLDFLDDEGS